MFVVSIVAVGALAALLVWQVQHVRSVPLALLIIGIALAVCVQALLRTRSILERLRQHFDALLSTADEQSRRAEVANRLKDEFLATLSHELRTPLNAVLGWARLLEGGKLNAEQTTRAIQAIERAGWSQARIIEDLLDVSHILDGRLQLSPRPSALPPLVGGVVQSLAAAATAKQVQVDVELDPDLSPITLDPDRVRQMLWHLLSNGIKFTPAKGRVEIGVRREGPYLRLWVADSGIGFDAEVASRLFERFRQADGSSTRPYGGLGLGLGMVRHLAELHGGSVAASSGGPGCGARFDVLLPALEADPDDLRAPAEPSLSLRGIVVLAVDDDGAALEMTRSALERFGAQVMTADSADAALECLAIRHVDVLLSDLRMPDGDGLELIRRVRASHGGAWQVPAAAVTALARVEDRRSALDAGFQAYVAKPVDPGELAATVAWLSQHRLEGTVEVPAATH